MMHPVQTAAAASISPPSTPVEILQIRELESPGSVDKAKLQSTTSKLLNTGFSLASTIVGAYED